MENHRASDPLLRAPSDWPLKWQYALALGLVGAALVVRWLLDAHLQGRVEFLLLFTTLLPLALLVRPGPFFMAAVLGFLGAWLSFPPSMSLRVADGLQGLLLGLFGVALGATVVTAWLSCRVRDAREREASARLAAEQALARELSDHRRVQEISCRLIPTDDVRTLYKELIDAAIEITQADRGTMQSLDHESGELCLLEAKGMPDEVWVAFARVSQEGRTSCAEAWRRGERVIVDYVTDERVAGTDDARAHLEVGIRAAQSTPLMTRSGRLAGILTTHWDQPHQPSGRSLYLLDILARQAADLVERTQVVEELREADSRKDEFLATLAHELRNPLAAISTAIDVLNDATYDPRCVGEMTGIIERQSAQLVRLIDDLLDVSRISRGKVKLERHRVDVGRIVKQVVADSLAMFAGKGLESSAVVTDRPLMVVADPVRLAQVVNNLLHNACKFTPRGGQVRVTVEREGGEVVVRVADTGIGMPREQLTRIFTLFAQVEEGSPSHRADGLGIGLSLAKSIVELHGGKIEARSEGPGKGSELILRLLASDARPPDAGVLPGANGGEQPARPTEGQRIVTADDNHDALHAMAMMLRMRGHQVETAADGVEALEKVREHRPDIALLDIGMPGIDGYAVARRIRNEHWGKDMLLVAMTGWGQESDKELARAAGFDMHLTKPVDLELLGRLLARRGADAPARR